MSTTGNRRHANREATRTLIVVKARAAFAAHGYSDAQLTDIVSAAGVTTGAVYHHFRDKKGLFLAVAEMVEQEILDRVIAAAASSPAGDDLWRRFALGMDATLEICAQPDVQRIVFVDAPTVIGPAEWRQIEMRYAFGGMHQALAALMQSGAMRASDTEVVASMLLGAIIEAAGAVARSEDKATALGDARALIGRVIEALRA